MAMSKTKKVVLISSISVLAVVGGFFLYRWLKNRPKNGEDYLMEDVEYTAPDTTPKAETTQSCQGLSTDPVRKYTKAAIKQMQNWLLKHGNNNVRNAIIDSGGADGYCGAGFTLAVKRAKQQGIITGLDNLRSKSQ